MKLVYYPLNFVMELERGKAASLVLEAPTLFERFVVDFFRKLAKQNEVFAFYEARRSNRIWQRI